MKLTAEHLPSMQEALVKSQQSKTYIPGCRRRQANNKWVIVLFLPLVGCRIEANNNKSLQCSPIFSTMRIIAPTYGVNFCRSLPQCLSLPCTCSVSISYCLAVERSVVIQLHHSPVRHGHCTNIRRHTERIREMPFYLIFIQTSS